jgi:hypothetical protein
MKITLKKINDMAISRQQESLVESKDIYRNSIFWWFLCVVFSTVAFFINGFNFSTYSFVVISLLLIRIGVLLSEISSNIRTTIRQNDDMRLLLLANLNLDSENEE